MDCELIAFRMDMLIVSRRQRRDKRFYTGYKKSPAQLIKQGGSAELFSLEITTKDAAPPHYFRGYNEDKQ
ncbi:hypothetical protein [Halobacillus karajensis]|uniref:hypothetical protein n=1 Tax=Halobacillus karajensis TaxID=195088 RepID=UPI0012DE591A|nr:hypothetical protein [Halobacillus karajensis]